MRVVEALRRERPDIRIHARGDAGFGLPVMYGICEKNGLFYTFGFTTNPRLRCLTEPLAHPQRQDSMCQGVAFGTPLARRRSRTAVTTSIPIACLGLSGRTISITPRQSQCHL